LIRSFAAIAIIVFGALLLPSVAHKAGQLL